MATPWGICTTLKAPADQVLAFVAHHLSIGVDHIWLHFDDPDDPAIAAVAHLPRVTSIRCDDAWWQSGPGRRPVKHQVRQVRNVDRLYRGLRLPWLAHIDVDEFLLPARPMPDILAEVPAGDHLLRLAPWEALHTPGLPDDIFTARHFRGRMRGDEFRDLRRAAFGDYADLIAQGSLSHSVGKCIFRSGITQMEPRIHTAVMKDGSELRRGPFAADIPLLHFHAQDPDAWRARLAFRQTRGAYSFNPALMGWLAQADDHAVDQFYDRTQVAHPVVLDALRAADVLLEADLGLRAKVAALQGPVSTGGPGASDRDDRPGTRDLR